MLSFNTITFPSLGYYHYFILKPFPNSFKINIIEFCIGINLNNTLQNYRIPYFFQILEYIISKIEKLFTIFTFNFIHYIFYLSFINNLYYSI